MSDTVTTDLHCVSCRAITAHVFARRPDGTVYGYRCTTETEDGTCATVRLYDATVEDGYGVGLLSEAWAVRDAADATALRGGAS